MAYTEVGVVNLALQRLGADRISALDDDTPQAEDANAAWEYVRDEVLEAGDWHFAKSRTTLSQIPPQVDLNCGDGKHLYVKADKWLEDTEDISIEIYSNSSDALSVVEDPADSTNILIKLANATTTKNTATLIQVALRALTTVNGVSVAAWTVTANTEYTAVPPTADIDLDPVHMTAAPSGTYSRAYLLPSGFLKVAQSKKIDRSVDPTGALVGIFTEKGLFSNAELISSYSGFYPYAIESLENDTLILVTDYDASESYPLELVYIRKVTDVTKWTAHFISAVAFRLAAELAFIVPESAQKFDFMMQMYDRALKRATGLNQSSDWLQYETGSDFIELAGRS